MVESQQLLDLMGEPGYKPMTYQELEKHFKIDSAEGFKELLKLLNELENEGLILRTRSERYGLPERLDFIRGKLQAHSKGFGFLLPDNKEHPDVYIGANDMGTAMNGDIVLVKITSRGPSGGRLEGEIVKIVKRSITQIVGVFQSNESFAFVVPDDKRIARDIFIPKHAFGGAVDGMKVVVNLLSYPEGRAAAEGEIIEVLGHKNDPGVDILSIIRKYQLPEGFSEEVLAEANAVPDEISEEEIQASGRRDLRHKTIVTIDGEDAKDLDDAVNVERLENGNYVLGVHIADVSFYVTENSALDREAYNRGNSVYLVDRVIPMLPHRLSNGICSLNPKVNRMTMSCEMEFDQDAKLVRHDIFTSVIKTTERMTYTNVRKILDENEPDAELLERYAGLVENFKLMKELALKLRGRRFKRGAIDFDFVESKILVDEDSKPTAIVKRERSIAEQIIEEFMLAANETVAEHFYHLRVPFLYRVHEDPDVEKLMNFAEFITSFGYSLKGKGNSVHPKALQSVLEDIKGAKEEKVISTILLRSMKQARYDDESLGHYGLAAEFYSHFTSPIRRYPDLIIHRVIREVLEAGQLSDQRIEYLASRMDDIAKQTSERERIAVDAEREVEALKKAEFMLDKLGEEFEGLISSVTSFGIFIELENTVEGLIRMADMTDDYYIYHERNHMLKGERTGKEYRLGDEVKIRVAKVNMDERTIDFELVDMKPRKEGERGGFKRGGGFGAPPWAKSREGDDSRGRGGAGRGNRGGRGGEARGARSGPGKPKADGRGPAAFGGAAGGERERGPEGAKRRALGGGAGSSGGAGGSGGRGSSGGGGAKPKAKQPFWRGAKKRKK